MDLGYDNPTVTAKCWCFLFVVRDWIHSKKSEPTRKEQFEKETRVPTVGELAAQLAATKRLREAIESWAPRRISADYLHSLTDSGKAEAETPEAIALRCLALWKRRNFGGMAGLFWGKLNETSKGHVREIREQFEDTDVVKYSLTRIVDEAPAVAEIIVETAENESGSEVKRWLFRLLREDEDGNPVPANLGDGRWKIVSIHAMIEQ
ncbi:hypothetical protein [Congregicoccus parvus]|uniref:hypothetical protein n=1 Tax=Congregicoccus parvus TaxID=3081749 RepID=UPI003FA54D93